jgi:hypothetical protein
MGLIIYHGMPFCTFSDVISGRNLGGAGKGLKTAFSSANRGVCRKFESFVGNLGGFVPTRKSEFPPLDVILNILQKTLLSPSPIPQKLFPT